MCRLASELSHATALQAFDDYIVARALDVELCRQLAATGTVLLGSSAQGRYGVLLVICPGWSERSAGLGVLRRDGTSYQVHMQATCESSLKPYNGCMIGPLMLCAIVVCLHGSRTAPMDMQINIVCCACGRSC